MHRPRHAHTIFSLRMAAFLLFLTRALIPAALLLLLAAVVTADREWSKLGLILGGGALVIAVIQWIFASSAKCPLCMMPVLSRKGCSKHRLAARVAGSHRFPVALGVLFKGHFRCPFCNEPTLLEVREPSRRRRS